MLVLWNISNDIFVASAELATFVMLFPISIVISESFGLFFSFSSFFAFGAFCCTNCSAFNLDVATIATSPPLKNADSVIVIIISMNSVCI